MSDFEWPPDEIAGPPAEENKPQGTRASAATPQAPSAGVPMPVAGPRPGIPMSAPQQAGDQAASPTSGLPLPPQRQQPAVPVTGPAPIPVRPTSAPVPVTPPQGQVPPQSQAPQRQVQPQSQAPQGQAQPSVHPNRPAGQAAPPPPPPPAPQQRPVQPHPRPLPPPQRQASTGVFPVVPNQPPAPAAPAMPQMMPNPAAPTAPAPIPVSDEVYLPTAEEFARRRAQRPPDPIAHMGLQAALRKTTFGLVKLTPGQREQEIRKQTELVRRNFGGLRQITVVNPKGGAGKTCAVLLLAMTFGRKRGGYVLAWDNNETQGTLGMRSQQDFHSRTVRDLLRDLHLFQGINSRVGDLSQYVRAQGDGMFEVLASDESATAGEMLTSDAFAEIREVVSRFYKLIMVDTGNNVRAENWQSAIDATDQLVVTMSARNDSAETAARMLDHLEQTGRQRLVRQAVSIVSLPPSRKEVDVPAIERHFAARTRAVLIAPYERMLDSGEPIEYARLSEDSQDAWLAIAAAVAEGL